MHAPKVILFWHAASLNKTYLWASFQDLQEKKAVSFPSTPQSDSGRTGRGIEREEANVTGKSQIWLHVGSVSFTLTFASRCFCSLKGYCLYIMACLREPCPSAWMLNQGAFVQGNIPTLSTCGWLQERRNEHIPSLRLAIPGDICKTMAFLLYFLISSPSLCYKRNWDPKPDKTVTLRH